MNILIAGGTGFIGRQLVPALIAAKHSQVMIGRDKDKTNKLFKGSVKAATWDDLSHLNPDEFDAIINLTGENIAAKRWSESTKTAILNSRIQATSLLVKWAEMGTIRKPHLYNASAVGFYGLQDELAAPATAFTEHSSPLTPTQNEFCGPLVMQWEKTALMANDIPVTLMRFGVVLKRGEGMLKKLELPAKLGLGAVIGTGKQPIAWIDCDDLVSAIVFLIEHPDIKGPVNLVAPECVSQHAFTTTLSATLKRPVFVNMPSWLVKMLFGQMGEELLLSGQTVAPERLMIAQFNFKYPTLASSLAHEFRS
jgi:uncharacterized protein (TIGR01777 family)